MVDFQKKIKFLYATLYNEELNELTKAFIPSSSPSNTEIRSRKVTLKKWLYQTLKKEPNKFYNDYFNYPISNIKFKNGDALFPIMAFTEWSLDEFENRYFQYIEEQENKNRDISLSKYKYIYYYHEGKEDLAYFEILHKENNQIELTTEHAQKIKYYGEIIKHTDSSMLHFIVSNKYEMMFFSFSKLDMKLNFDIYGIGLSKDFHLRNPKSSPILLTQNILSQERQEIFKTKINPTNILIVDNDKRNREISFIDNFSKHIRTLEIVANNHQSETIFVNLFLKEFHLFYQKFYNFYNKHEFESSSLSVSIRNILQKLILSEGKYNIRILYTLKDINMSLFSPMDDLSIELYNTIIEISKTKKISFEFVIALKENIHIDEYLKEKFEKFEKAGVSLRFREYQDIFAYSTLVLIDKYPLAISCIKGEKNYKITKFSPDISRLENEYKKQRKYASFLHIILKKNSALNGTYYMYCYGSNNALHTERLYIDGDTIKGVVTSRYNAQYEGKIYKIYGDVIFCTEHGVIKFKEEEEKKIIKIIPLLGNQHHTNKPIILFAILSRVEIEEEDRDTIFLAMIDKDNSPYERASFNVSLSIDEVLRPILHKYEEIERNQLLQNNKK